MVCSFAPGCHGSDSNMTDPEADIAAFLLPCGGHAWLGHDWSGCSKVYEHPVGLDKDYGVHVDKVCKETKPSSMIFQREWTKASAKVDCNTWRNVVTMKFLK